MDTLWTVLTYLGAFVAGFFVLQILLWILQGLLWLLFLPVHLLAKKTLPSNVLKGIQGALSRFRTWLRIGRNAVLDFVFPFLGPVLKWGILLALAAALVWITIQKPVVPLLFILGYLLAWKAIPWLYVKILRGLGFKAKMTPITQKRVNRFKRIKRGYYSFIGITTLFVMSLFLEMMVNSRPLYIRFGDQSAYPAVTQWLDKAVFFTKISYFEKKSDFGQLGESEVDYTEFARYAEDPAALKKDIDALRAALTAAKAEFATDYPEPAADATDRAKARYQKKLQRAEKKWSKKSAAIEQLGASLKVFESGDFSILQTVYPFSPEDLRLNLSKNPPNRPSFAQGAPLGTDQSGRDVVPLLLYGFRISLVFALVVAALGYTIGIIVGGIQGYYGGWIDILSQRFVEIWGSIPFLFLIMIIASMIQPTLGLLIILLVILRSWLGITYYVRGEFYREKAKDYVQAAIGAGVSDRKIILRHILPNALVPVVTFAPFGIVAYIGSLVSLDFLGFGLPAGTPSWGALLRQGLEMVKNYPHLVIVPSAALACTLFAVVMVGEAVREAFDPKVFSRLR